MYVKDLMGHCSIQVTVDLYGHLIPGGNTQAVDRLDLGGGRRVVEARICNPRATGARVPGTSVVGSASISRSYEEGVWGG